MFMNVSKNEEVMDLATTKSEKKEKKFKILLSDENLFWFMCDPLYCILFIFEKFNL